MVKIRVLGNFAGSSGIVSDVKKLKALKEKIPKCAAYLLVFDRKASRRDMDMVKRYCELGGVEGILFPD